MKEMDHNSHSVYLLYYHLVMVVKYRRKVINAQISDRAKEIFEYIAPNYGIVVEEWNHDIDHVHVMFRAQPRTELSKFINAYKSASSRLIKKEYPEIREKLWKEAFWSQSFCLVTAGGAPLEVIRQYIESQGKKQCTGHINSESIPIKSRKPYCPKPLDAAGFCIMSCFPIRSKPIRKQERC